MPPPAASPWSAVMAEPALVAGAGALARPLRHLAVIRLDVCGDGPVTPDSVARLDWVLHPGLVRWLAGAQGSVPAAAEARIGPVGRAVLDAAMPATRSARSGAPAVEVTSRTVRVRGGKTVAGLAPWEALERAGRYRGVPVMGTPRWFELARLARDSFFIRACPGNPTRVRAGVPGAAVVMRAPEALALAGRAHADGWVSVDGVSLDLADMALAAEAGREGLTPAQDIAVSVLLATETGAVLALPPGTGKTVVTSAALNEGPDRRSAVVAPAGVVAQWRSELAVWAPARDVRICLSRSELPSSVAAGQVVVTTIDLGAQWLADESLHLDDLIVDEAAVLLPGTRRAVALRQARGRAVRAWALTGTPEERSGAEDCRRLVAWVRDADVDADVTADDLDPVLVLARHASPVPTVVTDVLSVTAQPEDLAWLADLRDRGAQARTAFDRSRLSDVVRRGLGDRLSLGDTGESSKRRACIDLLAQHAAAGGVALACTESVPVAHAVTDPLEAVGVQAGVLSSALTRAERTRLLSAFTSGDVPVLLVTPGSQRGVNLQRADLVVHLDLPSSLAQWQQRNARAARMGSTHARVRAVVPVLSGTWDEAWWRHFSAGGASPLDVS